MPSFHIVDQFGSTRSSARLQESDQSAAKKEIELGSVAFSLKKSWALFSCPTTNQGSHLKRGSWEVVVVGDANLSLDWEIPDTPFLPVICDLMELERRLSIPESRSNFRRKRQKEESSRGYHVRDNESGISYAMMITS